MCSSYDSLILQIGRLDKDFEKNIKFKYSGKTEETPLSSIALKKIVGDKLKVILIYPVSLALNSIFKERNDNDFFREMNQIINNDNKKEYYIKNPKGLYENHPHSKSKLVNSFFCIHSIGTYENTKFEASVQDIALFIFAKLIEEYAESNFSYKKIFVDVSSGLNIYVTALLEALRYFQTWEKLFNLPNSSLKYSLIYTDPIIGRKKDEENIEYNIYEYKTDVKAFFSSPITYDELDHGLPRRIIEEQLKKDRENKKKLIDFLEKFLFLYSSFTNGIPLALFNLEFTHLDNIEEFIRLFVNWIIEKFEENFKKSPMFNFDELTKVILSLSFLRGLIKIIEENKISKRETNTNEIFENISKIYKSLGLYVQSGLIEYEIIKIINACKNENCPLKNNGDWIKLDEVLPKMVDDKKSEQLNERNFFAHAGFERTVTLIKKEDNIIYLKYDENKIEEIENMLKKHIIGA
jgi:CRISPR-associated protein Csx1